MVHAAPPELSVIVPLLNEREIIFPLMETLARQRGVALETILCDGGSTDGTVDLARALQQQAPLPVTVVESGRGRGRQINRGALAAKSGLLLFIHADSTFPDPSALRTAIDSLAGACRGVATAGKFRLRFRRSDPGASPFGYYFYESKANLLRRECTHGDQGLLLPRQLFEDAGPFDESSAMLAETRFADTLHARGALTILPPVIETSARRFETEGLRERQTLNAIIMNFAAQEWDLFFRRIPHLYRPHDAANRLPLPHLVRGVLDLMASLPLPERRRRWLATGGYVRGNAWQIAFALDAYRNFRNGLPPGSGPTPLLDRYDRTIDRLTDHKAGRLVAALLVWVWAKGLCLRVQREGGTERLTGRR